MPHLKGFIFLAKWLTCLCSLTGRQASSPEVTTDCPQVDAKSVLHTFDRKLIKSSNIKLTDGSNIVLCKHLETHRTNQNSQYSYRKLENFCVWKYSCVKCSCSVGPPQKCFNIKIFQLHMIKIIVHACDCRLWLVIQLQLPLYLCYRGL